MSDPTSWQNRSPGHLDLLLDEVAVTPVAPAVEKAVAASKDWAHLPLTEKIACFHTIQAGIQEAAETLALGIAVETGKPLTEARGEVGAVIAKFDHTIQDAETHLAESPVSGGPHPAAVVRRPRGPAAVIGPFNFPLHLGNGAILAHLLAGNPVLFKPSPFAPLVAARYGEILGQHLPPGVFQIIQGFGATSEELCLHPAIRSICFTGSIAVGRRLAVALAPDFGKDVALELGGKNALVVCADADLAAAAKAAADGVCLTSGQRCNGTSRILVEHRVLTPFSELFRQEMRRYIPGDPTLPETTLGPVINAAARERHEQLLLAPGAETFSAKPPGLRGHYVLPAAIWRKNAAELLDGEQFVPCVEILGISGVDEAIALQNATEYGLAAAIFTKSAATFQHFAAGIEAGNVYANLPTTFSPSTLPFGGWKNSGNHHPGGKGFLRFTTHEQALQWTGW